ncbi:MAG: heavy metal translocating P-type ATPase metal-binding domain-containing protein, partial [Deltaproteobacteria bacterium]|nr:heavy metal translocating P-type ATPase metal-binding domain-containing protein [Deltaproteobacteria bacterium]
MRPTPSASQACPHCGTATEDGDFCCVGCEAAAALLSEAGLDRYYAERTSFAPRPGDRSLVDLPVLPLPDGTCELRFAIDGLTCASCTWVAETLIARVPGVDSAHVSYGSGTAKVRFDPAQVSPAALVSPIRAVGWTVRALAAPRADDRTMLLRLGVAAFAAMNVMMISAGVYAGWLSGMDPHWQKLFAWSSVLIATPVATWSALPFYRAAIAAIRVRRAHVDIPVSLGVLVMYAHGLWAAIAGREGYLDSLGMLVTLLLAARVAEQRGRRSASEAARAIGALAPARARRIGEGKVEELPASALRAGDRVTVAHGEEIAADGVVEEGDARVQMSLLTGESTPREVRPGDEVVAGALVVDGNLVVRVRAVGAESLVGRMAQRLSEALDRPVPPTLADQIAPAFTAGTLLVATVSFAGWTLARGVDEGVAVAVAVLVVA